METFFISVISRHRSTRLSVHGRYVPRGELELLPFEDCPRSLDTECCQEKVFQALQLRFTDSQHILVCRLLPCSVARPIPRSSRIILFHACHCAYTKSSRTRDNRWQDSNPELRIEFIALLPAVSLHTTPSSKLWPVDSRASRHDTLVRHQTGA